MVNITIHTTKQDQKIALNAVAKINEQNIYIKEGSSSSVQIKFEDFDDYITIPKKVKSLLYEILNFISEGRSFSIVPEDSDISTQQAADMLKVSRPHIVKLLEQGEIPFKKVGTHRRLELNDLLEYETKMKQNRAEKLKLLSKQAQDLNLGYE